MEEGKIIWRENIRPSSPTPQDKRVYKLSLLDQSAEPILATVISYYPSLDEDNRNDGQLNDICETLKQSLSKTLTTFYPLAGRILTQDGLSVDCNDEGALFIATRFDYSLSDFLRKPDLQACWHHVPTRHIWSELGPQVHLFMVKVSFFDCGGIAIGINISHKVVDAVSTSLFLRTWAANARLAAAPPPPPDYWARSLFPQNKSVSEVESDLTSATIKLLKPGKSVVRRYVFEAAALAELKSQLTSSWSTEDGRPPSRVETISALIWKCVMVATANKSITTDHDQSSSLTSVAIHAVNMRRRADPPFPDNSFGNFVWAPSVSSTNNESGRDLTHLVTQARKAIAKVDADCLKRMQGDQGFSGYCKNLQDSLDYPSDADVLLITSWCNLGFYELDFGWGKPMWIGRCDSDQETGFPNMLLITDTRDEGIEAWLTLDKQLFDELEKVDQELRHFASVDPSPFKIVQTK